MNRLYRAVKLWALALPSVVSAQPTDLFTCLSRADPTCQDIGGPLTETTCPKLFENYYGRVAFYPLRCVGSVTVEVETYASWRTRFPLYVEVVPLTPGAAPCENAAGNVILIAHGGFEVPCGTWETAGPVDITSVVPIGSLYAIRLYFLGSSGGLSPGVDCVRVTAHPVTSSLASMSWGQAKILFK